MILSATIDFITPIEVGAQHPAILWSLVQVFQTSDFQQTF